MDISPIILSAIYLIKQGFDGLEVDLLSDPYRDSIGHWGVDIKITIPKTPLSTLTFLSNQMAEDIIVHGQHISDQFIYISLKDLMISLQREQKINDIIEK